MFIVIAGCGEAYEIKLNNDYWLWALDSKDDMALMVEDGKYRVNVVSPKVTSYFYNDKIIAVTQEAQFNSTIKSTIKTYYIVPLIDKVSNIIDKNVIGPLNFEEFQKQIKAIDLSMEMKFIDFD